MARTSTEFTWNTKDASNHTDETSITSKIIELSDGIFALRITRSSVDSTDSTVAQRISLHLKGVPKTIGALKVNYSIRCKELFLAHTHDGVVLGKSDDLNYRWALSPDTPQHLALSVSDNIDSKYQLFADDASFDFNVEITIVTKFDRYGGIFSSTNKQVYMRATQQSENSVFGFVHEILEFDLIAIQRAPLSILKLIHRYFLMILNSNKSTRAELEWRFDDPSAVSLFNGSVKGDVLTSRQFEICGCVFYLELTPNGWGTCVKEGMFTVWVALAELPTHVGALSEVELTVRCDEIGHTDVNSMELGKCQHQQNAPYSFGGSKYSTTCVFAKFKDLERFTFHVCVEIKSAMDNDGKVLILVEGNTQRRAMLKEKIQSIDLDICRMHEVMSKMEAEKEKYLAELSTITDEEIDHETLEVYRLPKDAVDEE